MPAESLSINRNLRQGSSGEDVRRLQDFLKQFPDIYPEGLATGYFGKLSEKAVKKLQEKFDLEQVGQVGPKTSSILFRKIDSGERCLSRIVGTDVATPLFIQFESSAVASTSLAESLGYFVAASTTQTFDSAIFGCGTWAVRGAGSGATGTVQTTELR